MAVHKRKFSFDDLIEEATELRRRRDAAQIEFFLFLWKAKHVRARLRLIEGAGYTFAGWLTSFNLCKTKTFEKFERGFAQMGHSEATARNVGFYGVFEAGEIAEEEKVEEYAGAIGDWRREHGDVYPQAETAERLRRQVAPRPEVPKSSSRQSALAEENAKLKAELKVAKAEIRRLESENKKLRQKLERQSNRRGAGGKNGTSRKASRKSA